MELLGEWGVGRPRQALQGGSWVLNDSELAGG